MAWGFSDLGADSRTAVGSEVAATLIYVALHNKSRKYFAVQQNTAVSLDKSKGLSRDLLTLPQPYLRNFIFMCCLGDAQIAGQKSIRRRKFGTGDAAGLSGKTDRDVGRPPTRPADKERPCSA